MDLSLGRRHERGAPATGPLLNVSSGPTARCSRDDEAKHASERGVVGRNRSAALRRFSSLKNQKLEMIFEGLKTILSGRGGSNRRERGARKAARHTRARRDQTVKRETVKKDGALIFDPNLVGLLTPDSTLDP